MNASRLQNVSPVDIPGVESEGIDIFLNEGWSVHHPGRRERERLPKNRDYISLQTVLLDLFNMNSRSISLVVDINPDGTAVSYGQRHIEVVSVKLSIEYEVA